MTEETKMFSRTSATETNGAERVVGRVVKDLCICLMLGLALIAGGGKSARAGNPSAFGIDLPWVNYGADFGKDPKYGNGPDYNASQMQGYLNDIKSKHMNIVRIWLFEDMSGLTVSGGNYCSGVSQQALNNIVDFVNRANGDGITAYCMLFNNDTPGAILNNSNGDSLVNNVVTPLAKALNGKNVRYDLMNECDYEVANQGVSWGTLRNFLYNATNAIHKVNSSVWVTASDDNSNDFNNNFYGTVGGINFNFYDYHQYSNNGTPLRVTPAAVHNAPLYLGEFGPNPGWDHQSDSTNQQLVDYFVSQVTSKGYTGMLAWSYTGDSNYQIQNKNVIWNLEFYGSQWGIN